MFYSHAYFDACQRLQRQHPQLARPRVGQLYIDFDSRGLQVVTPEAALRLDYSNPRTIWVPRVEDLLDLVFATTTRAGVPQDEVRLEFAQDDDGFWRAVVRWGAVTTTGRSEHGLDHLLLGLWEQVCLIADHQRQQRLRQIRGLQREAEWLCKNPCKDEQAVLSGVLEELQRLRSLTP